MSTVDNIFVLHGLITSMLNGGNVSYCAPLTLLKHLTMLQYFMEQTIFVSPLIYKMDTSILIVFNMYRIIY